VWGQKEGFEGENPGVLPFWEKDSEWKNEQASEEFPAIAILGFAGILRLRLFFALWRKEQSSLRMTDVLQDDRRIRYPEVLDIQMCR
jgi:hypothetical protein